MRFITYVAFPRQPPAQAPIVEAAALNRLPFIRPSPFRYGLYLSGWRDAGQANYLNDYGTSLGKEVVFGDILKQLAGTRIAPLIRDLLGSFAYQHKVAQQKYDFLRTTEAFKKAMAIAMDKYDRSKNPFNIGPGSVARAGVGVLAVAVI